jgi:hypothetical protein
MLGYNFFRRNGRQKAVGKVGIAKLARGKVDRDAFERDTCLVPVLRLIQRGRNNEVTDLRR